MNLGRLAGVGEDEISVAKGTSGEDSYSGHCPLHTGTTEQQVYDVNCHSKQVFYIISYS